MNVKSAVLLVTGAAVAFAGATFYTKKTYENTIDHQLAIYKEVPSVKGVTMERTVIEEGFFWVNDEYRISLDPEFFNTMGGTISSTTSLKFAVNNDCHIFPFYISCDNRFEPSNDKITQEMAQHLQKVPYESNWSLNALTRTIHSSFSVEDAVFEENGADITIHPLHLFSTTDFDLKEVQFELKWKGAMLALPEEKLTWQFSQLATRGEMSRVFGTTFVYSIKTKINNYGFYTPLADIFKGEHLSFSTETVLHNDDTFSVEYTLKNALMQTFPPAAPGILENVEFNFVVAGFDKAAAELYARLTPVPSTDNEESLIAMLDAVGAKPLTITLDKLSFKYNEVPFQAQGRADIQPFKYAELLAGYGAEKLQAELSVQLGKHVTEVLPQFAPMLEQYVQMGMIEQDEDGAYKSQVQFNRKQLRANDNVVQQF